MLGLGSANDTGSKETILRLEHQDQAGEHKGSGMAPHEGEFPKRRRTPTISQTDIHKARFQCPLSSRRTNRQLKSQSKLQRVAYSTESVFRKPGTANLLSDVCFPISCFPMSAAAKDLPLNSWPAHSHNTTYYTRPELRLSGASFSVGLCGGRPAHPTTFHHTPGTLANSHKLHS